MHMNTSPSIPCGYLVSLSTEGEEREREDVILPPTNNPTLFENVQTIGFAFIPPHGKPTKPRLCPGRRPGILTLKL